MTSESELEAEIESWRGFPWAMRQEDRELWDQMISQVRQDYTEAVEKSGKTFAVDPFLMALLLAQQKTIQELKALLRSDIARPLSRG